MRKLDRLGWAAGLAIETFGVRIGIRLNRPDFLEQIETCFPPFWEPADAPQVDALFSTILHPDETTGRLRRFNLLYGGAALLGRTREREKIFPALAVAIMSAVAEHAAKQVFLHAGVVGWKGKAIVIPGRSCSGKTTLTAELVRAGATYYSDEFAILDRSGRVHPYPKPLAIRPHPEQPQEEFSVESLGGRQGEEPLPLGLMVVTGFHGDRAEWRPRRLSTGQGILEALDNAPAARRRPRTVLKYLSRALRGAVLLKGPRGDARRTAATILRALEGQGK